MHHYPADILTPSPQTTQKSRRSSHHFPVSSPNTSRQPLNSLLSLSLSLGGSNNKTHNHAHAHTLHPNRAKSPPPPPALEDNDTQRHGSGPSLPTLVRIPEAVGYDMETAADTDVGWLNVLLAHAWAGYRDDFLAGGTSPRSSPNGQDDQDDAPAAAANRTAALLMQEVLNRPKIEEGKLDFLDEIQVTECLLGNSYPTLSNARVRPRDDQGRVRVEIDVEYSDLLSLALRTAILVNYPRPRFAVLPISLGVRITRFSGTLSLSITSHPPSETSPDKRSRHTLELSLHPDFLLAATCSSLVGSRAKLQDIPKIQQLILQRIRGAIMDKVGWPRCFTVELPDLVRRAERKRTQRGAGERVPATRRSSGRMQGIAEEDEDEGEEEAEAYADDAPLDPQEALKRMRMRRRIARERAMRQRARDLYEYEWADDVDVDLDDMDEDPLRTPRTKRRNNNSNRMAGAAAAAGGRSTARPPSPSQYTSISRRRPNPLHSGAKGKRSSRVRRFDGDQDDEDEDDEDDILAAPTRRPPGSLPTVEAWRKDMVKRTHGGERV